MGTYHSKANANTHVHVSATRKIKVVKTQSQTSAIAQCEYRLSQCHSQTLFKTLAFNSLDRITFYTENVNINKWHTAASETTTLSAHSLCCVRLTVDNLDSGFATTEFLLMSGVLTVKHIMLTQKWKMKMKSCRILFLTDYFLNHEQSFLPYFQFSC